ncbi:MAG: helix-turn-helix transcriptional regulator [Solirubrobacteraceae bacterium]|nr:helix-turn-helix transcriptional regulator [Solirubrobacteraceae bacterium]
MTRSANVLGEFLRARREAVTPEQVGIPEYGVRRVPGLRREEVAMLAGVSSDYYLRLERGRDRNPSLQVLESIAQVLQLDDDHFAHLLTLVSAPSRQRRRKARKETPPAGALKLMASLSQPAFIEDRYFDILASNDAALALSPSLTRGGNQLRDLFIDPAEQALHAEWETVTECYIANLRQAVGSDIDDPRFIELTGELSLASARFRQLWARHEIRSQRGTPIQLLHPQVGALTLNRERLSINGTDHLMLVIYHPDAGTSNAEKLAILGSATLPTRTAGDRTARPA